MIKARGGMGSHKHGISGKAPRSPKYKMNQLLEANKPKSTKPKPKMFRTLKEALEKK